ncbi:MAG: hypothetical protein EPN48_07685 [Microbacteriaceae bacterium]|nr:MAG: hypothetical protein EPN48_07685 [Microbacteriaceae bacterium]
MSADIERTPQQLDPLGTYSVWLLAPVVALVAVGVAIAQTIRQLDEISSPALAAVALLLALGASIALAWGALPGRSPFRRHRFIVVLSFILAAALCCTASTWGLNILIQDDWGQLVVAMLIATMARLRPTRELVIASIVSAVLLGVGAGAQSGFLGIPAPPLTYALVAGAPPIVIGFGAAAYGHNLLRAIERWRARAMHGMARLEPEVREGVTRSVQQAYVTTLNDVVAPLIERVLRQNELTVADTDAVATIADTLRGRAIGLSDASWLDDVVERTRALAPRGVSVTVSTARNVVDAVTVDQRAVVGAALGELMQASELAVERVQLTANTVDPLSVARFEVGVDVAAGSERMMRSRLRPYLTVLRVISDDACLRLTKGRIEVEFSYDLDR